MHLTRVLLLVSIPYLVLLGVCSVGLWILLR